MFLANTLGISIQLILSVQTHTPLQEYTRQYNDKRKQSANVYHIADLIASHLNLVVEKITHSQRIKQNSSKCQETKDAHKTLWHALYGMKQSYNIVSLAGI